MLWNRFCLILFLVLTYSSAQIGTIKIAEPLSSTVYDSTKNFLGKDAEQYKGCLLYLVGRSKELEGFGYGDFKTQKNAGITDHVYKCCAKKSKFNSNYNELAGTTFKVLDVTAEGKAAKRIGTLDMGKFVLTLQNLKDSSICYYKYNAMFKHNFPFIDMRYFEKIKSSTIGNKYYVKNNSYNIGKDIADIEGKTVDSVWSYEWECKDVIIEETYFTLSLLLQNSNGKKIVFQVEDIDNPKFIISAEAAKGYKNKFGSFWQKIMQNIVAIGMSREMVKLSWGKPEEVNSTIFPGGNKEQWIYKGNYVYFTNGVVDAIQ